MGGCMNQGTANLICNQIEMGSIPMTSTNNIKMSRTIRKEYTGSKRVSKSCRCNGGCSYCRSNRMYSTNKRKQRVKEEMKSLSKKYKKN